jgi:hypothetical protein
VGASAEDDINLKKLKYMDVPILILLFRYAASASDDFCRASFCICRYWRYEKHLENLATGIIADIPESQSSMKDDSDPYLDIIEESGLTKGVALQVRGQDSCFFPSCYSLICCVAGHDQGRFSGLSARLCAQRLGRSLRVAAWTRGLR